MVNSTKALQTWRNGLFLENLYSGRDAPLQKGYIEDGWKYVRFFKVSHPYSEDEILHEEVQPVFEMLFDLKSAPEKRKNLIRETDAAAIAQRLRAKCAERTRELNARRQAYRDEYLSSN